jgi:radical SAM superfamily enzyme YgiQ (UPF0313 family)
MKIILARPPKTKGGLEKSSVQQPINLCGIAAYLNEAGHDTRIWDFEVEDPEPEVIRTRLEKERPDIVGFTALTATIKSAHELACLVKVYNPDIPVMIGGPHASALPKQTLQEFPNFDVVVVGEGEQTALEITHRMAKDKSFQGIFGTAYREQNRIVVELTRPVIKDLDTIPYPDRSLLRLELYKGASTPGLEGEKMDSTELFTSRGCAEKCIFCTVKGTFGLGVRFRSPENVLGEIKECIDKYGFRHFTIEDDTFTYKKSRLTDLCHGFKDLGITWDCDTRVDQVDEELFRLMKKSGCVKVAFGIESGSPRILRLIKKRIELEQVRAAFKAARKVGLTTQAFFIVGSHPTETIEDIKMTKTIIREIKPDFLLVNVMVPFPGTELYDIMAERGYIDGTEDWNKFDCLHGHPTWKTDMFTGNQLIEIQKNIMLSYTLTPFYMWRVFKKMLTPDGFKYYTSATMGFLKYLFLEERK